MSSVTFAPVPAGVEATFQALAQAWKLERGPSSSTTERSMCPSYQRIIGLGPAVVPLLLRELDRAPDHWFWALKSITGADPVPDTSRGKIREMAQCWLDWGRAQRGINGDMTIEKHFPNRKSSSTHCAKHPMKRWR